MYFYWFYEQISLRWVALLMDHASTWVRALCAWILNILHGLICIFLFLHCTWSINLGLELVHDIGRGPICWFSLAYRFPEQIWLRGSNVIPKSPDRIPSSTKLKWIFWVSDFLSEKVHNTHVLGVIKRLNRRCCPIVFSVIKRTQKAWYRFEMQTAARHLGRYREMTYSTSARGTSVFDEGEAKKVKMRSGKIMCWKL